LETPTQATRERFWPRQFSPTITTGQVIFDVIVGAIIPILLLIFDPVVFRQTGACVGPVLANLAIFAYLATGLGTLALVGWLLVDKLKQSAAAIIAGVLLTGAAFAGAVGVALVPTSIFGLFVCIGVLGFFPFLVAFIYFRNGIRAFRAANSVSVNKSRVIVSLLAGIVLAVGLPGLAQVTISNAIQPLANKIIENPVSPDPAAVDSLKQINTLCLHLCTSAIAQPFEHAILSSNKRQQLDAVYKQITGGILYSVSCNTSE
jgi:hypothetical protein